MTMNTLIIGLLAETSVHPGTGQSADIIDLPVAREAATGYPVITGSSLKGALADYARDLNLENKDFIFGKQDNAGALLFSDARLLLLPVRSLTSAYKWVTCPHLIERWQRDCERVGKETIFETDAFSVPPGSYLGGGNGNLFLEERQFAPIAGSEENQSPSNTSFAKLIDSIKPFIKHASTQSRLADQLVVISDDDFAWFARNGLGIQARNVLDIETKSSSNLWYEEYIPADALYYAVLVERKPGAISDMQTLLQKQPYVQVGGNETVGAGWFALEVI